MIFKLTLLTNLLLASAALAVPSSLEARLARRRENRRSQPLNRLELPTGNITNSDHTSNWAGAVWDKGEGTFNTVTGTFTVPALQEIAGSASVWVGIDGDTCESAILRAGVDLEVTFGGPAYIAWFEWYPAPSQDFTPITISAGDVITATVTASSTTTGEATIENVTNGQNVSVELLSSAALCGKNAAWVVEDFDVNNRPVPFTNFGTVQFSEATASGSGGATYTPSGAKLYDIQQNGKVLTSTSVSGSALTISYV